MDNASFLPDHRPDSEAVVLTRLYYEGRHRMRIAAMTSPQLSAVLRKAIEDAATNDDYSMLVLRLAVECFTADLRDGGMMPEGVLVALKKIVLERKDIAGIMIRDQINLWFINEFFTPEKLLIPNNPPPEEIA
jgi:hypothetical protein